MMPMQAIDGPEDAAMDARFQSWRGTALEEVIGFTRKNDGQYSRG